MEVRFVVNLIMIAKMVVINSGRTVTNGGRWNNPNFPLRGSKGTLYEGGTEVPRFIHSPLLRGKSGAR